MHVRSIREVHNCTNKNNLSNTVPLERVREQQRDRIPMRGAERESQRPNSHTIPSGWWRVVGTNVRRSVV
jgi:hypothetical protein